MDQSEDKNNIGNGEKVKEKPKMISKGYSAASKIRPIEKDLAESDT